MDYKAKILVVDDEQGIREMLSYELGLQGYCVATAADGLEGVAKISGEKFDLVTLDMKMPKLDGAATLEKIKEIDPDVEVIVATGYGTLETAVECMKRGAYDYIAKPFNIDELGELIRKALEKRELKFSAALNDAARAIFSSLNLGETLDTVIKLIVKTVKADDVALALFETDGRLRLAATHNLDGELETAARLKIIERSLGEIKRSKASLLLPAAPGVLPPEGIKSSIVCPLLTKNKMVGALNINRGAGSGGFTGADVRHLSIFAAQMAQALENAELCGDLGNKIEELKKAYSALESAQMKLVESEKMASLGVLAGGVAHELSNPLAVILGFAQMMLNEMPKDSPWPEYLKNIEESTRRCKKIIGNLLRFAKQSEAEIRPVDINETLDDALELCGGNIPRDTTRIIKQYAADLPRVYAAAAQIQQVFVNLTMNACHAMREGGDLTIATRLTEDKKGIEISFADTGEGIDAGDVAKVFDPFFTTKDVGKGAGLGLSVSYGVVTKHGGRIRADSAGKNKGACFTVFLPVPECSSE